MPRIVFGAGLPMQGGFRVPGVTLGEALEHLEEDQPWLAETDVRCFVGGVDADRLEGKDTPVGDEDMVLLVQG